MEKKRYRRSKTMLLVCSVLLLTIHVPAAAFADLEFTYSPYIETVYDESNGLPTGEANEVIQTQDGYIWIASYGGLLRYNGKQFINYSEVENGLPCGSVRTIYEDTSGNLWIGSNDCGIFLYRNGSFLEAEAADGIQAGSIRDFVETDDGTVYAATIDGLVKLTLSEGIPKMETVPGTEHMLFVSTCADYDGNVWSVTGEGRILIVSAEGTAEVLELPEPYQREFCYVFADDHGRIHLGTRENQVVVLIKKGAGLAADAWSVQEYETDAVSHIDCMFQDSSGYLWIGGKTGLGYLDPTGAFFKLPGTEDNLIVTSIMEDYEGNYWVSSSNKGILLINTGKFQNPSRSNVLYDDTVNAIYRTDGWTYAATNQGLVILDENQDPVENTLTNMLNDIRIRHICEDHQGNIWLSAYGTYGAVRYTPQSGQIRYFSADQGMSNDQARMVLPLLDGTIAVAGNQGIDILEGNKIRKQYRAEDGLSIPGILCMEQDRSGTLYAGSDGGGIYQIRDGQVHPIGEEQGLEDGVVLRIREDPEEPVLWVSAGSDLYQLKDGICRKIETLDIGVGSIFDIQFSDDEIWLLKSNGIFCVRRQELLDDQISQVRKLGRESGLGGTLVANSWNRMEEDGTLYICTGNGISILPPKTKNNRSTALKGVIEGVVVDGVSYSASENIIIPETASRVTFDLAVLSYSLDEGYVECYLEGFDTERTVIPENQTEGISYTNLPGGDYIFHMQVMNAEREKGEEYCVKIHKELKMAEYPLFWLLAVVGLTLLTALVVYVLTRKNVRKLRKRQKEYHSIIDQSLSTFANTIDAKDEYTNGHSHRVADYAREIARRMKMPEEQQEMLYYTALLHDIGKIGTPDRILKKEGKLTEEEWAHIRSHPEVGGRILKDFTAIPGISDGARYHHERFDGTGYNEGLKGKEIPLYARIICIADAYDAMASRRCYRDPLERDIIVSELEKGSGTQFDPDIVVYAVEMAKEGFVPVYESGENGSKTAEKT